MWVVTGASGFVGKQLVERLKPGTQLLLVSRDAAALRTSFPEHDVCSYQELGSRNLKDAIFLHLAVQNNDRSADLAEFRRANVELLMFTARAAREGGAARFINLCTTHALETRTGDFYGLSKLEGAQALRAYWPDGAINLYVPAIYGTYFHGRLARLSSVPSFGRGLALGIARVFKPLISIDNLAQTLFALADAQPDHMDEWRTEHYAADPVPPVGVYAFLKRSIDLLAALVILAAGWWFLILVGLYIRLDSKGPALFAQPRVGQSGRTFTCYKFRTMRDDTKQAATHLVTASAVTRAGLFLRRTKLDELPQIANILMNQMSLVGPRPSLPNQSELIDFRNRRDIFRLKPGITGLAQVNDIDMSEPARLAAWDDRYKAYRTTLQDFALIVRTVSGAGRSDRVSVEPQTDPH